MTDQTVSMAIPVTTPNSDAVHVSQIDWLKVFPWLHLLKAARLGIRLRVLVPSMVVLICLQWQSLGYIGHEAMHSSSLSGVWESGDLLRMAPGPVALPIRFGYYSAFEATSFQFDSLLIVGPLLLLLMFSGTAIARSAATEFCSYSRTGAIAGTRFSARHVISLAVALLIAIFIVGVWLLPVMLAGPAVSLFGPTLVLSLSWLTALTTMLSVLALVVCTSAWLIAFGAVGTDKCGGADALSRGINYTLSHKLFTAWCLWLSCLISFLTMCVVRALVEPGLSSWARSLPVADSSASKAAGTIAAATMTVFQLLPAAVHLGTFLSAITITYVLLRQREDGIDLTEIDGGQHIFAASKSEKLPAE